MLRRSQSRSSIWRLALVGVFACARAWAVDEGELKAAIIFNVLLFVEWPADVAPPPGSPMVLCLNPGAALGPALKALQGRELRGTRLDVRDAVPLANAQGCHAAFIDGSDSLRAASPTKAGGVLVISDDMPQASPLAALTLRRAGNRIALDVNLEAARNARLQLSSKLLRVSHVVKE